MEEQREEILARLEHLLSVGKLRFVLKRGVLLFGVPVAFFTPLMREFMDDNLSMASYLSHFTTPKLLFVVLNALLAGVIFGFYQWWKLSSIKKKLEIQIGKKEE